MISRSPVNGDLTQAPTTLFDPSQPYEAYQSVASQEDQSQNLKLRCPWPECPNTTGFGQQKDLNRHERWHEGRLVYCGCCLNGGVEFGLNRRDKLLGHLRKDHQLPTNISPIPCPDKNCHNGETSLFTTASCLAEHLRQNHPAAKEEITKWGW